ncbi:MAG: DedA family protein [Candidatus Omnitrophota bacterium]
MEFIGNIIQMIMHMDKYLAIIIHNTGNWVYLLLFGIIFCETGLVITPFLPGDSLLFAVGALAALRALNLPWLFIILICAAVIGDSANYAIGKSFGIMLLSKGEHWFFKKKHLERTHKFYEKYGGKTIILARFVPIVRTFAPFVAGIGRMSYLKFLIYNIFGGALWVVSIVLGGYFFGNIKIVKNNFSFVILAIMALSLLPVVIEIWRHKISENKLKAEPSIISRELPEEPA